MWKEFLVQLRCPFSGSSFRLTKVIKEDNNRLQYGIISSDASDFPVIEGILRLSLDELRTPTLDSLHKKDLKKALSIVFESPFHDKKSIIFKLLSRIIYRIGRNSSSGFISALKYILYRKLIVCEKSFCRVISSMSNDFWGDWQKFRYSMETFIPSYPLLNVINTNRYVLDFGCGIGHATYLISKYLDNSKIICIDNSFSSLYLNNKYFVHDANFICMDGNDLLPLKSSLCSGIFSCDAFHFMRAQLSIAQEFKRVLCREGTIIMSNLHNKNSSIESGHPLTPNAYESLFQGMETRLLTNNNIIKDFINKGCIDLQQKILANELAQEKSALSLIASNDKNIFKYYENIWDDIALNSTHPIINPIYQQKKQNNEWELTKKVTRSYADAVEKYISNYANDDIVIPLQDISTAGILNLKEKDYNEFIRLLKQFVIIEAPKNYN